jgi:hypothetical protein
MALLEAPQQQMKGRYAMKRTQNSPARMLATLLAISAGVAVADYDLSWHTIDGGGATATGGDYELSGTIGQPDAGTAGLTGGDLTLTGGFWPGTTPFCHGDITGDGEVGLVDLAELMGHYGETGATYQDGDLTGDGEVSLFDLAELFMFYGDICW